MHMLMLGKKRSHNLGFTIVELLIVIVVIAVLAAITVMAFNGIQKRADDSSVAAKDTQAKKKLEAYKITNDGTYPANQSAFDTLLGQIPGDDYYVSYQSFSSGARYAISTAPGKGPITDSAIMQTVTDASCPLARTRVVDARDNNTYWIQKMADNRCWMLTNLAYGGGGTDTYKDVKSIQNGTAETTQTYNLPRFYVSANANPTSGSTNPSTATDGGASNPQYGYHYNWCAAMGAQIGTSACFNGASPLPDSSVTICPSGWRLPIGGTGEAEIFVLNQAINNGVLNSDANLRSEWLHQRAGYWNGTYTAVGGSGYYWHGTQGANFGAFRTTVSSSTLNIGGGTNGGGSTKYYGFSVRCIAV